MGSWSQRDELPAPVKPSPGQLLTAATALRLAGQVLDVLRQIRDALEREPDFDTTYVVGGVNAAAAAFPIQIPRTIRHMEITLAVDTSTPVSVALLPGNVTVADAQNRHKSSGAGAAGSSGAIVSSSGGSVTVRDYSDGSGYLTVFMSAAATTFASVRVRSLDGAQLRTRTNREP